MNETSKPPFAEFLALCHSLRSTGFGTVHRNRGGHVTGNNEP